MDAEQIRGLEPLLVDYLKRFDDCFARRDTRAHFPVYVRGQLSELPRKSVEPIALAAGTPVRTLQEFLTHLSWDEDQMRSRVGEIVALEHADTDSIGIIDETGWVKKGNETPGVQRQYCGSVGKQENSIVTVHLGYVAGGFRCLLDADLFLPESWSQDRERCRRAGIPDDVVYRPKSEIALELYDRVAVAGVHFEWLTFDEWYGGKPQFLRALTARDQKFVGEIPKGFVAWIKPPRVTTRPLHRKSRGAKKGKKGHSTFSLRGRPQPQSRRLCETRRPAHYNWVMMVTKNYSNGQVPILYGQSGWVGIQNRDNSPYGSGWAPHNADRLAPQSGGSVVPLLSVMASSTPALPDANGGGLKARWPITAWAWPCGSSIRRPTKRTTRLGARI